MRLDRFRGNLVKEELLCSLLERVKTGQVLL